MTPQIEEWLPISGYEAQYSISNLGRVMRTGKGGPAQPGHIRKPALDACGYLRLPLTHNYRSTTCKVHRLVAEAFLGPIPDGHTVNHIDGIKTNNTASNLEIVTRAENVRHSFRVIKTHSHAGEKNPKAILDEAAVRAIRKKLSQGASPKSLVAEYGVTKSTISGIRLRKTWSHVT